MDFKNIKDPEQREAINALRRVAEKKLEPVRRNLEKKVQDRAIASAEDIGIGRDTLEKIAGAAMAADALNRGEIEGGININDDLRLEGKVSPRENAIKLLYNKSF
jgi:hypothetical protein